MSSIHFHYPTNQFSASFLIWEDNCYESPHGCEDPAFLPLPLFVSAILVPPVICAAFCLVFLFLSSLSALQMCSSAADVADVCLCLSSHPAVLLLVVEVCFFPPRVSLQVNNDNRSVSI